MTFINISDEVGLWYARFHERYGFLPTKLWVDRLQYRMLLATAVKAPYTHDGCDTLMCGGIPVYER